MVKVSIICVTYNHAHVIRDALDGFLKQEASFDYEVLIHDDSSTDGTQDILIEYRKKHPYVFRLLFEEENQVSKGNTRFLDAMFKEAKGEYIALCDGDDYWIDQKKLQSQVDYLDAHKDYALCFHPVSVHYDNGSVSDEIFPNPSAPHKYNLKALLEANFIQTNSVMYRRQDYGLMTCNAIPNDWYLHIFHARFGKIGFINKPMAVYRRHEGGMWWRDQNAAADFWDRNAIRHVRLFENIEKLFSDNEEYLKIIYHSAGELIGRICHEVGESDNFEIATKIATTFPRYAAMTITQNVENGAQPQILLSEAKKHIEELTEQNQAKSVNIDILTKELATITTSKSWKLTQPLRALKGRLRR